LDLLPDIWKPSGFLKPSSGEAIMAITDPKITETASAPSASTPGSLTPSVRLSRRLGSAEARLAAAASRFSRPLLRVAMGTVFIWFGALKVAGTTPVADLVAGTVPWLDRSWFVPALGAAEILMGIAVLIGWHLTLVCAVITAHLCGTFLVLVMEPGLAFQNGNPLLLTTIGEFVVKNVVLISAALVLASSSAPRRSPSTGESL
jgi:putative oxidoreductase